MAKLEGAIWQLTGSSDGHAVVAGTLAGEVAWIDSFNNSIRSGSATKLDGAISLAVLVLTSDVLAAVAGTDKGEVAWIDSGDCSIRSGQAAKLDGKISHLAVGLDGRAAIVGTSSGHLVRVSDDGTITTLSLPTNSPVTILPFGEPGEFLAVNSLADAPRRVRGQHNGALRLSTQAPK